MIFDVRCACGIHYTWMQFLYVKEILCGVLYKFPPYLQKVDDTQARSRSPGPSAIRPPYQLNDRSMFDPLSIRPHSVLS